MSLEYFITSLIVIVLPGTGVLYTLAVGLGRGFRASIAAAFGCTLGILPAAIAGVAGLAALLHASALAFSILKYLGVAYLFYMAWNVMRQGGAMDISQDRRPLSWQRTALNGALLNVLNPKLTLFFMAFLPQFVPAGLESPAFLLCTMAAIFMGLTFIVFAGYGGCAALARDHVVSRPSVMAWLRYSFAGVFGLLGLRLALSER